MSWKNIKIDQINSIEKLVSEFDISALSFFEEMYEDDTIHYGSFKVRIYESQNDESTHLIGYTNLKLKDPLGGYEGAVGYGKTVEDALQATINNFLKMITEYKQNKKSGLNKEDFTIVSYDEF